MPLHDPAKFLLIAGPCSLETMDVCEAVATELVKIQSAHPELQIVFKGSFDKANRTSLNSPRGPGLEKGLEMLAAIKAKYGFPLLTDFHTEAQAPEVGKVVDILQVPAFLCRQTDLLVAAARTGRVVNVKKGQFLSPPEMRYVVDKLEGSDAQEIWLTERGTTFGYQNLVVDMRNFPLLKAYGHPVIFDATHSVQMPGAGQGTNSGKREFVPPLARAAIAAGADGLFVETHPNPDQALSDGPNQVPLDQLTSVLEPVLKVWQALKNA
ncbi:MAG TPA: 3-deoxy-8-phosphooctulonate synthase [Oceanipulchritudo sp.]|nr:3-deoxy-8-phosphooctulonate synthase [Oceanipulchritudo sp.]